MTHDHPAPRRPHLRKRGRLSPLLACGVAAVATSARAEPAQAPSTARPERVEVIVVTASRSPRSLATTLGTVSVITAEDIAARNATSVVDVLRGTPGLYVDQPGGRGSRASIFIRGLDPNQAVVLIDGIRVNDPTNNRGGSFDFSTLDVYAVERIEIVRGPLSAIHGSDALGGAINIITRRGGDEDEARAKAEGGRFGFVRANGGVQGSRGPFDFALSGAWVVDPDDASRGDFEGGSLTANLGAQLPAQGELRAVLRFSDTDSSAFPDNSGGVEFAQIRQLEDRDIEELTTGFTFRQPLIPQLDLQLAGNYYHRREDRSSPGIPPGPGGFPVPSEDARDRYRQVELRLQGDATLPAGFGAVAGADVRWENGKSDSVLDLGVPVDASWKANRVVWGSFLDAYWSSPWGLRIEAAVRVEWNDGDTDTQAIPRVGLLYPLPWVPLELRANWGQGFKLPSLFALNNGIVGNGALKPEKSDGYDLSLDGHFFNERLRVGVTWFDIRVDDLIDFDALTFSLVNRDEVKTRGIELHAQAEPLGSVLLEGNLTYTHAEIVQPSGGNAELLRRPRWRGHVAVEWEPHHRFALRLQALLVGSVKDSSNPTGPVTLDPWQRVDLAARWQPLEWLTLTLGIENLLNQDYEQAVGFPSPRIRPRAGVEIRLSRASRSSR